MMKSLPLNDYKAIEKLHESTSTIVWRAERTSDSYPVILKIKKKFAGELKNETRMFSALNKEENVVSLISVNKTTQENILVLEDDKALSLKKWLNGKTLSVKEFLIIAIKIVKAVESVHSKKIIHKDLNPSNIIIQPDTGVIKLIDFQFASFISEEKKQFELPRILEGTIAYLSPEQTGRVSKAIDYCSDLYSLGVSFYELLTGTLPFVSKDPLEVIHAHLALQPHPPHQLNAEIPQLISDIIMKLLDKNADARYQSAFGLYFDLERFLQEWNDFPLGEKDFSRKLLIPKKLYGREQEIERLFSCYDRVVNGGIEVIRVVGYSGIGKSVLVKEICKSFTDKPGYFISGKFDQLQRNTPYSAIVHAFGELIEQLLTESETRLEKWQKRLLTALGSNGQVIIDVIPQLEWIIAQQPSVPALSADESKNRFNRVFQNLIRVFCRPEHPLVLFLDDMQWADSASLQLLEQTLTDKEHMAFLLIAAYRDNQVDKTHQFIRSLEKLCKQGIAVNNINLKPLAFKQVNQLIADSLHHNVKAVASLTELVMRKTAGNPFFVNQFLHTLYDENLLVFQVNPILRDNKTCQYGWHWDTEQIEALNITDNVVDLVVAKLKKLPQASQQILRLASCMGNRFDLDTLSIIYQKSLSDTFKDLLPALTETLILPLSEPEITDSESHKFTFIVKHLKFLHDRVQQAAYALIDDELKQAVHLRIGRLLLKNTATNKPEEKVFEIVEHFNQSINLLDDSVERHKVAELNLSAGRKAMASAAYGAAANYLEIGRQTLNDQAWQNEYNLSLALFSEAIEAAYLNGDFRQMDTLVKTALKHARCLADEVRICETQILAFAAQNRHCDAIKVALHFLQRLNIELPEEPTQEQVQIALQHLHGSLSGRAIRSLIDLPDMTDADTILAMRIMMVAGPAAYHISPGLLVLMVVKQVGLSLEHGNIADSSFAYVCYGFILCGIVGDIESGYQFGQLGLDLLDRLNEVRLKVRLIYLFNGLISLWKKPLGTSLPAFLDNYQAGLEAGNIEYSAYSLYHCFYHAYFIGKPLAILEHDMDLYSRPAAKLKQTSILDWYHQFWQVVINLKGHSDNACRLLGKAYNEEISLPMHEQANDRIAIHYLHLHKCILHYLFYDYRQALQHAELAEQHLDSVISTLAVAILHFYDALTRLALFPDLSSQEQHRVLEKVNASQKKMQQWAHHAPMNFLHKYYLVEAERARVLGNDGDAREFYDKAIDLAHEYEYINEEALAYELAGRFYLHKGKPKMAFIYLRDAHFAYQRWGAMAKVKNLEIKYPQFLTPKTSQVISKVDTHSTSTKSGSEWLDLNSIMKANRILSGEIVLSQLLEKMIHIVIENAGAEKGFLLLPKQNSWFIEAQGYIDKTGTTVLKSIPAEEGTLVSASIIHYVARSHEQVVLHNATQEGIYQRDQYIVNHRPKSILCFPLKNQGQLTGILYLENNLTTGAFTPDRLEVLNHLSSQIAISLENSLLYSRLEKSKVELEKKVEERTRELDKSRQAAELLARTDPLTTLNNRRAFYEFANIELDKTVRHQRKLTVVMMDIDYFKKINDTYGHNVGDSVLKAFAKLIKTEIRNTDISARFGGEEFVILFSETDKNYGQLFAERLRTKTAGLSVIAAEDSVQFTSSFGIAEFNKDIDKNIDDILFRADKALYKAKENGRNRVELAED